MSEMLVALVSSVMPGVLEVTEISHLKSTQAEGGRGRLGI